jgi:predicted hexulose-6-phosphate isomerase
MRNYELGLYEKSMPATLALADKLVAARDTGYDYLELSIDETDEKLARLDWTGAQVERARLDTAAAALPIKSICLSAHRRNPLGDPDAASRARSLDIMQRACSLAAGLGVRIIQLAGYDVYYKEGTPHTAALFGDALALCAQMAARSGITLAFETMETPFMDTVAKAVRWVERTASPWLQMYPDVGNLTNAAVKYGGDVIADMRAGAGHIASCHLKETTPGVYREVPFGAGHVDFPAVAQAAYSLGVRMFVAEFWHSADAATPWRETLSLNNAFLRKRLDAVH